MFFYVLFQKFCFYFGYIRTDITRIRPIYDYFMGFKTQYNFEPNPKCYYPNPTRTNKILVWNLKA